MASISEYCSVLCLGKTEGHCFPSFSLIRGQPYSRLSTCLLRRCYIAHTDKLSCIVIFDVLFRQRVNADIRITNRLATSPGISNFGTSEFGKFKLAVTAQYPYACVARLTQYDA